MRKHMYLSAHQFEPATSKKFGYSWRTRTTPTQAKGGAPVKSVAERPDTSIKMVNQMTSEEMTMAMGNVGLS